MAEGRSVSPPGILRKLGGIAIIAGSAFLTYKFVVISNSALQVIKEVLVNLLTLILTVETKEACLLESIKQFAL